MMITFELLQETLGWLAVVLTASQFIPQAVKSLKTKSTKDLSWWTFIQTVVLSTIWVFFGVWRDAVEIVVANVLVNLSCDAILLQKYLIERPRLNIKSAFSSLKRTLVTMLASGLFVFLVVAVVVPSVLLRGILGWMNVGLNITQFIPQAVKSLKTKSTRDLSWWTFIQVFIVTILWTLYGFWNGVYEVAVTNMFVNIIVDVILVRKYLSEKA